MRIAYYTCILGDYEVSRDPMFKDVGVDYILFTDKKTISSKWDKILYVEPSGLTTRKTARCVKALAHQYLADYDITIWVDGNFCQSRTLLPFLKQMQTDIVLLAHPSRKCTYTEGQACLDADNDYKEVIQEQMYFYHAQGFPENSGLVATGLIIRKNTPEIAKVNEDWWHEILGKSGRDQLSFNYVAWVNDLEYEVLPWETLSTHFERSQHKQKRVKYSER